MKFNLLVNWKLKAYFLTCVLILGFGTIQAQTVKGTVTGEGDALPGVTVLVKGTANGTVTDFDGNYEIKANATDVLMFSYIGFSAKEVSVKGKTLINVVLTSDVAALDEVVVVGYGSQKKTEVTGAVVQVTSEELNKTATSDLSSALQGQIAGVTVVASDGSPGSEANIMIRGLTSINGANKPLYVVDGVPYDGDPRLSVAEVETIDVLKDAASAAVYGTRGAAGVILITTKKGKEGTMKISADGYYGTQMITSGTPIMNREDRMYAEFLKSWAQNGRVFGNTWTTVEQNPATLTNDTNLVDTVLNDFAPIQNYGLSVSGGQNGLTYNVVGNFFDQEGVVINSAYERFNIRANSQFKHKKWLVNTGISFRVEDKDIAPWGILKDALKYSALQQELNPDATEVIDGGTGSGAANLSYLQNKLIQSDNLKNQYFDGNIAITYKILPTLKFTTRLSAGWDNGTRVTINPLFIAYDDDGLPIQGQQSKIYNQSTTTEKSAWENILNWKQSFGDHNLDVVATYSSEKYSFTSFFASKFDINNNAITVINGATGTPNAGSGTGQWGQDRTNTLIGMLGRVQYNYKGKYLASASVRRDGSSRFKKQHWGTFPSFSAGWNMHQENFYEPIKNVVNTFKLRGSYGTTGNQGIADYAFASTIVLENDYVLGAGDDTNLVLGATQQAYANSNVKWETSVSTNLGLDLSFLKNSLTFSGDIYKTNKEDMLFSVYLPPTVGAGEGNDAAVVLNVGDMVNTGIELAANYRHSGKVNWSAGLNWSKNDNEITKMSGTNKIIYFDDSTISGTDNDRDAISVLAEGYEGGAFMLIKTDGVIKTEEELADYKAQFPNTTARLGDLRLVDALTVDTDNDGIADAGDGIIDINDRQYSGSGTPDWEMGFNGSVNYANFDLSAQVYAAIGGEIMNGSKAYAYQVGNHQDIVHEWTPQNTNSNIPVFRGSTTDDNVRGRNDYWLEDGTYVRLRNITLGYSFPNAILEKLTLAKLRLYVAGQNLITITDYTGFDPEVGNNGLSTRGIDKGTYPVSSQVRVGLEIQF